MSKDYFNITVEILDASIKMTTIYDAFIEQNPSRAIHILLGCVDHQNQNKAVKAITYEIYESLAKQTLLSICKEAKQQFEKSEAIYAAHTKGYIEAGGLCTLVIVSANNFKNAGEGCAYIGEQIKRRLPIWKLEHYVDGTKDWLPGQFELKAASK